MNFTSLQYYAFLPVSVLLYYVLPQRFRNPLLLALSYLFYMCWRPEYALLLLFSTALSFFCARPAGSGGRARLAVCVAAELALLFLFKYLSFFGSLISPALSAVGLTVNAPALDLVLPVGISFYIFRALGYSIDVYRGEFPPERSFVNYALFVSFFPQLASGPIERSRNLLPQLRERHAFSWESIRRGLVLVLWGLFKKLVLADGLARIVAAPFAEPSAFSGLQLAAASVAFTLQLYCDFSAYTDIARGSGTMLGFRLMRNFDSPLLSLSVKDFWRRWHISLSSWFRDYLYIPLGGGRRGRGRKLINLLIVFTLSGLWHGAAPTFVAWGLLNGLYLVAEELLRPPLRRAGITGDGAFLRALRLILTFALISFAFIFFRADTISAAFAFIGKMLAHPLCGLGLRETVAGLGMGAAELCVLAVSVLTLTAVDALRRKTDLVSRVDGDLLLRYFVWLALLGAILVFGAYGSGYDSQEFIYFKF